MRMALCRPFRLGNCQSYLIKHRGQTLSIGGHHCRALFCFVQARQILVQNPQLTKALFQAQILLGMVKAPQARTPRLFWHTPCEATTCERMQSCRGSHGCVQGSQDRLCLRRAH